MSALALTRCALISTGVDWEKVRSKSVASPFALKLRDAGDVSYFSEEFTDMDIPTWVHQVDRRERVHVSEAWEGKRESALTWAHRTGVCVYACARRVCVLRGRACFTCVSHGFVDMDIPHG